VSAGHDREFCRSGGTDRDAIRGADSSGSMETRVRCVSGSRIQGHTWVDILSVKNSQRRVRSLPVLWPLVVSAAAGRELHQMRRRNRDKRTPRQQAVSLSCCLFVCLSASLSLFRVWIIAVNTLHFFIAMHRARHKSSLSLSVYSLHRSAHTATYRPAMAVKRYAPASSRHVQWPYGHSDR